MVNYLQGLGRHVVDMVKMESLYKLIKLMKYINNKLHI